MNSFASFLASRANEQIYNQASEGSKVDLRAPLRGAHPRRPRQVAPERPRHLAARGPPERDDRAARLVGGDRRARALGRGGRGGERRRAPRDRPVAASARPSGRTSSVGRGTVLREGSDAVLARLRAGDAARGAARRRAAGRAAASCRSGWWRCRGSTASTRTGSRRRSQRSSTSSCSRTMRRSAASATALRAALAGRAGHGLRRRGLARVRDARRGAPLPRARRRVARSADRRAAPASPAR